MRLFCATLIGLAFAYDIHTRAKNEQTFSFLGKTAKYPPYIAAFLLPIFLLQVMFFGYIGFGKVSTSQTMLSICFSLFLHISIYYSLLLPILPILRKRISSRACAILWLIPNYLYLMELQSMALDSPLFVITAPGKIVWTLLGIWFAGFCGIFLWKIASHLFFRKQVLKGAEIHPEIQVRQQWKQALIRAKARNQDIPLLVSPHVTTPVAIGLFTNSTVVILPTKPYSREDLELIFLHEIIHIERMDPWYKFFLMFCTAICWFNPLMWLATSKSAEDMERSCDETVLLDADDSARKHYAAIVLSAAGDGRGFTTCLSSSAKSLRYRLKNIVAPGIKSSGAILVGAAYFLLAMTYGYVALAYDEVSGMEAYPQLNKDSGFSLTVLNSDLPISEEDLTMANNKKIQEYLSDLTMYRITGQYHFSATNREALIQLERSGDTTYWMFLSDRAIEVHHLTSDSDGPIYYYIPDGIDWSYLDTLIKN